MKKGTLYGVGVGPGDPELVTLKAVRLIKESDIIAVPDQHTGEKTALNIVKEHIENQEIMYCYTPMVMDMEILDKAYENIADDICKALDDGKNVAFITLGDPSIYSTYMYVHKKVVSRGYEAEMIPGVPSFCAVAAKLGQSLCERKDRLLIVPASREIDDCIDINANKIFMKAGSKVFDLQEQLKKHGKLDNSSMVENCGMENERVYQKFGDMKEKSGYFSIVLVKEDL